MPSDLTSAVEASAIQFRCGDSSYTCTLPSVPITMQPGEIWMVCVTREPDTADFPFSATWIFVGHPRREVLGLSLNTRSLYAE